MIHFDLKFFNSQSIGPFQPMTEQGWSALFKREDVGFFDLCNKDYLWSSSVQRAKEVQQKFTKLVVLGIGGSSLGGKAIKNALMPEAQKHRLQFWDTIDADKFWQQWQELENLAQTHFAIVSKSGGTMETLSQANFVAQALEEKGLSLAAQSTVISENKDNSLTKWAQENQVPQLEIPLDVGGRFSALTPVGLFPAAFAGIHLDQLQEGARWALQQSDLIKEWAAHCLLSFEEQRWITLFWAYAERWHCAGEWWQQLWAESLGKAKTREGAPAPRVSSPFVCRGPADQHSLLQQVVEGSPDKWNWFVREQNSEGAGPNLKKSLYNGHGYLQGKSLGHLLSAEADATQVALKELGSPSLVLKVKKLDAAHLGAFFMLMELLIGTLGETLKIDAFNQPGVERGKVLARDIMAKDHCK